MTFSTIETYHQLLANFLKEYDPDEGSRADSFLDPAISKDTYYWLNSRKSFWRRKRFSLTEFRSTDGSSHTKRRRLDKTVTDSDDLDDPEDGQRISYFLDPTIHQTVAWITLRKLSWKVKWGQSSKNCMSTPLNTCHVHFEIWLQNAKTRWKNSRMIDRKEKMEKSKSDNEGHGQQRYPKDIMPIFDSRLGLPDDIVAYTLSFIPSHEHIRLLYVNKATSKLIRAREDMWRALCPPHWTLPKRPRKPWCDIYVDRLLKFEEVRNKHSDDILVKASETLLNGDYVQTLDKFVSDGERTCSFDINYTSGTVEERNSLLNLAVINRRHKCVRWLVEVKGADIQTMDRGLFTPLHNAAWMGDTYMVRYLLRKGADRSKIAKFHSSTGVAQNALGMTAEQWARKRGHHSIADLIQRGL